jgi:alpha-tubulin suppressor-like RCC1 family protein
VALMIVGGSFAMWNYAWEWLWQGPVGFVLGLPMLALAVLALMFRNFQILRPDRRTAVRNLVVFVAALMLGTLASAAVYHRFWEKFTAFEPAHGAARLAMSSPATLSVQRNNWFVRLPDGKIWQSQWERSPKNLNPISRLLGNIRAAIVPGKFISGSNWLDVQRSGLEIVGLKNDGTLWASEKPLLTKKLPDGQWERNPEGMDHLVQFGTDTNWTSLASEFHHTLLTKSDGTLWEWGDREFNSRSNSWPGLRAFSPLRAGAESDWAEILQTSRETVFYKTDGSAWATGDWDTNLLTTVEILPGWVLHAVPALRHGEFRSQTMISHGRQFLTGIANDGTFRIFADQQLKYDSHLRYGQYVWSPTNLLIDTSSNWLAVAGGWQKVVTLKKDGTLWLWNFGRDGYPRWRDEKTFASEVQRTEPVQLGTQSDWTAISGNGYEVVALAADGSLWYWPLTGAEIYDVFDSNNSSEHIHPVLDISRKPQLLGNVFEAR